MVNSNEDPFDDGFQEDPFIDDHFSKSQARGAYTYQEQPTSITALPDATAVLVLGILGILGSFCYGIFGLILGIVALAISGRSMRLLRESPGSYSHSSISNLKAGRICAIVGLVISGIYLLVLLAVVAFYIDLT